MTWLFTPRPLAGLGVFRICLGFVALLRWSPRLPHVDELYAAGAFTVPWGWFAKVDAPYFPFPIAAALFATLLVALFSMAVGYRTRVSTIVALLLLMYFVPSNTVFPCAVDRLTILSLLFLSMSPAGRVLSVDRWLEEFARCRAEDDVAPRPGYQTDAMGCVWTQQMIGVSFVLLYIFAPIFKLGGDGLAYFNGEAIGYAVRRWQFATQASLFLGGIPIVAMSMAFVGIIGEWFIAVGLYVRKLRPFAIALGIGLHLTILYTVLIPMELSLIMIASYVLYIEPNTWRRVISSNVWPEQKRHWLVYDGQCTFCRASVRLITMLDWKRCIEPVDLHASAQRIAERASHLTREQMLTAIHLIAPGGDIVGGFFAMRRLAQYLPFMWLLLPMLYLPGMSIVGPVVYREIARRRYGLVKCTPDGACRL